MLPRLALAHLELGQAPRAQEIATEAVRRAHAGAYHLALVDALRAQGLIAQRQERWDEARRVLNMGLRMARDMCYPYAEARLLYAYGEMYAQQRAPQEAREQLTAALVILRRLGAHYDAERVAQIIASITIQ